MAEDRAVAEVAAAVADGEPVDWTQADVRLPERERRLIPHLRLVQSISHLYRTLPVDEAAPAAEPPPVERWGSLVMLELIGEGTTGEVYRAWDSRLHRDVALKLLHKDRHSKHDAQARMLEEARRLARLRHEHVVSVYGAEEHDGRVGLWMELVRGGSLEERVKTRGPLASDDATRIGRQLCSALSAVHGSGLLHRDVKAQNVIQEPSGRIVLMDFGTGEQLRRAAGTNRMVGTPLYLAPEIFKGEPATVQSDVYSLGVLLFYLVTGEFPVTASSMLELGRAHSQGTRRRLSELRPDLPKPFVDVVGRALQADPARRYSTAAEMELALQPSPQTPATTGSAQPAWFTKAGRWPFAAAAVVLVTLTVALIVWTRQTAPLRSAGGITRLAVAPMTAIDPLTAPPFLAEGLTDQLISTLGQIQSLRVQSSASAGAAAGSEGGGSSGGVDAVLQTTLLTAGAGGGSKPLVRVNARLVAAGSDTVIWAQTFEHALGDTFALQAAIAREIATAVNAAITPGEHARLSRPRQTVPEADLAFIEGRAYIEGYGVDDSKRALNAFQRAINADPQHAAARAGAARAHFTLGFASVTSQPVARALALAEAQKAIELDDSLPDAHAALADISFYYDWNWRSAEEGYLRSLELNNSYVYGRIQYSRLLAAALRTSEAVAQSQLAVNLQPASAGAHRIHGLMLYYHRDFEGATTAIRRSMEFERNAPGGWVIFGRIAEAEGRLDEALQHTVRALDLSRLDGVPAPLTVQHMRLLALTGRAAEAQASLKNLRLESDARGLLWNPQVDAYLALALGKQEEALRFLEDAVGQRQPNLLWIAVDPRFDAVRSHPRFKEIVQNLGLN